MPTTVLTSAPFLPVRTDSVLVPSWKMSLERRTWRGGPSEEDKQRGLGSRCCLRVSKALEERNGNHISVKAFLMWLLQQMNIWTLMNIWNETAEGAYKVGTPAREWASTQVLCEEYVINSVCTWGERWPERCGQDHTAFCPDTGHPPLQFCLWKKRPLNLYLSLFLNSLHPFQPALTKLHLLLQGFYIGAQTNEW